MEIGQKPAAVRFDHVSLSYGNEQVLEDLSFEIDPGAKAVVRGPSGTGKTTVMRLIMGFEQPDAGSVYIDGLRVEPESARQIRKRLAWCPQEARIGSGAVQDVLNFPFTFEANSDRKPDSEQVRRVLNDLALEPEILQKSYDRLSGGQKQRIALAMGILLARPLLLLDEPTASLDAASRQRVAELFLAKREGTVVSTSHDQDWISRCDKVIELY